MQPEIKRLVAALDACPEEALLRYARDDLQQLDHLLQLASTAPVSPLAALEPSATRESGEMSARAAASVSGFGLLVQNSRSPALHFQGGFER